MKSKRKILAVSEKVWSKTGFSKYYKEILTRLYDSGKFEIADLSCYSSINDSGNYNIPWKFYCNSISPNDPRHKQFMSDQTAVFGSWRFNEVLLDFKPDVVFSARDFWYDTFILTSPLRKYYHFAWAPTCDSEPVKPEWIEDIISADAIFAYNDWSLNVMKEQSNGKANTIRSVYPGVNPDIFSPVPNKEIQKKKMMFKPDIYLIGMVARNQKRKLFPDLFIAFEKFLNYCHDCGNDELAKKTFLFLHTSFPDNQSWNIPLLLKERNISHKVLFSYICRDCKKWFPAFFSDARTVCPFCGALSCCLSNTEVGVSEEELADIYRCFDLYSHLHLAAGAEMPIIEAAACGVYCMASDNTAVCDIIRRLNGLPLKLAHTFRELETGAYRHYTDVDNVVKQWYDYLTSSDDNKKEKENKVRQGVLEFFTWNRTYKIWEDYLENCHLTGLQGKWNSPPNIIRPKINPDFEKLSNKDFVKYLTTDILHKAEDLYKFKTLHLLSVLNYGAEIDGRKIRQIKREEVHKGYLNLVAQHNYYEEIRCGMRQLPKEDYLEYANLRMKE